MRPLVLIFLRLIPVAATFAFMLVLSWRKWADLIVDYGREVYVPWQLSQGSLLYRDIASFYGPLSTYLNSVLFRAFGTALIVPQLFNLLLVALLTYMIYRLFEREEDNISATLISCAFLILFAFGKHFNLGSYNYVAPYSHELVHGLFLSFASIYSLKAYIGRGKPVWVFLAGFFAGLTYLTKMEPSFALTAALLSGFALTLWKRRADRAGKLIILLAAGVLVPLIFFISFFTSHMGFVEAVKSVFSSWTVVAGTGISSSRFYKAVTGMDNLAANLKGMFSIAVWYLVLMVPLAANYALRKNIRARRFGGPVSFAVTGAVMAYFYRSIPWDLLFWPLPLFAGAILIYFGAKALRGGEELERAIPLFMLSVFAAFLLIKILFVVRIYGYGFVLAMPATLLALYFLLSEAPLALTKRWGSSGIFRYAIVAALLAVVSAFFVRSYRLYERMDYEVASDGDMIVAPAYSGGQGVDILLQQIERVMAPGENFVMLPEGALMNYLSRRENPTRYVSFLPSDMTIFGEENILAAFEASRPDYIILISRDTIEYGEHYLGQGYGYRIFPFIMNNYSDVVRIGDMGFLEKSIGMSQPLGIVIMKRNAP